MNNINVRWRHGARASSSTWRRGRVFRDAVASAAAAAAAALFRMFFALVRGNVGVKPWRTHVRASIHCQSVGGGVTAAWRRQRRLSLNCLRNIAARTCFTYDILNHIISMISLSISSICIMFGKHKRWLQARFAAHAAARLLWRGGGGVDN